VRFLILTGTALTGDVPMVVTRFEDPGAAFGIGRTL